MGLTFENTTRFLETPDVFNGHANAEGAAAAATTPLARKTTIFKRVFSGGKAKAKAAAAAAASSPPRMSTSAYTHVHTSGADDDELNDLDMSTFEHASEGPIYEAAFTCNPNWFEEHLSGKSAYLLPTSDELECSHLYTEMSSDCASTMVHDYAEIHDCTEPFYSVF